jgi:hypothetical protein
VKDAQALPSPPLPDNYPYSEIERIYDTTLTAMADQFFKSDPDAAAKHRKPMEEFTRATIPRSDFVSMLTASADTKEHFAKAKNDPIYRQSEGFRRELQIEFTVAMKMALITIGGRFDVYDRKFIHPNELSLELFPMAKTSDQEEFISWVDREASAQEVMMELNEKAKIETGDRFFSFESPPWYWKQLAGRRGYLQVRSGQIIAEHVTALN